MSQQGYAGTLRILTLNLWGRDGAWMDRRSVHRKGFHILRPDLLALQEVIKTAEYDQAADLLGPEWQIVHQQNRNMQGMGISIASRWPLRNIQELDLHVTPRTGDFPCGALIAEIMAPEPIGPLLFVNHFPSWQLQFEHERELQAMVVARVIEERVQRQSMHVVLAGDLDADPAATSIRFWCGYHALNTMSICYRDACNSIHLHEEGHTFTPDNPLMAQANWDWAFSTA
uniref:Endonuclease/exonuclease/phosphatase domain-containing protein n=1 Tax=Thermosporothrix sp. COM3 TaxID=2490863 RepID=A0A455SAG8_9CHLR|nr:hypothetical protein KTC_01840 [Thermosporothrix sp. COM3]